MEIKEQEYIEQLSTSLFFFFNILNKDVVECCHDLISDLIIAKKTTPDIYGAVYENIFKESIKDVTNKYTSENFVLGEMLHEIAKYHFLNNNKTV